MPSCGGGSDAPASSVKASVVASFYPLAYAAEEIGGASVSVTNLTPPGAEPHDLELSVADVERVRSADLVLYVGSGFQPAVERALAGADVAAIDALDEVTSGAPEDAGEGVVASDPAADPHVWLDPQLYAQIAERIGVALGRPRAAQRFRRHLERLDEEYERGLADCERREIVTSHAAFGYLARRYGFEQLPITGVSPEAEPTPGELEQVVEQVRAHGATTVFVEPLVSPRLAATVARETGAATAVLNPLEGLTEEEDDRGVDYFSLMRANLEALRISLGCR
jgi:zinc transport system substrate-binding protein